LLHAKEKWESLFRGTDCSVTYANTLGLSLTDFDRVDIDVIIVETHGYSVEAVELIRRLRQYCQHPILLVTAGGDEPYHVDAYRAGADECIWWTISDALLLAKLRVWLRWTERALRTASHQSTQRERHSQAIVRSSLP
jgi:DNA-binding response OmpR family regulator